MITRTLFLLLSLSLITGCQSKSDQQDKKEVIFGKVEFSNGWARPGSQGQTSGAYITISNGTASKDTLLNISSEIANKVELHESYKTDDGMSGMRPAGQQVIESGSSLALEPGGLHIMFIDLQNDLAMGDSVTVSFKFARIGNRSVSVPVQLKNQ